MSLLAGAAVKDISPHGAVPLFGYPHVKRLSAGMHDPLLASVLRLDNGRDAVILVALDILMIDPPTARSLRRAVASSARAPEEAVFISCSHTHSGPVTSRLLAWEGDPGVAPAPDPAYLNFIETQVTAAAAEAASRREPASLAWTSASALGVGGNRLSAAGVTDPECGVLAVRKGGTADFLALVLVYGMHPTVLHEDSPFVSSDFPHFTRTELQERLPGQPTVLYHTAPAGDQSPRHFVKGQTFAEAERLGRKLGSAVVDTVSQIESLGFTRETVLRGRLAPVELPGRHLPSPADAGRLLKEARAEFERLKREGAPHGPVRTAECAVFGAESAVVLARARETGALEDLISTYRPIEVQVVRIGAGRLIGLPGELFCEYALDIKRRLGPPTFAVSLVNGELQGYIVTPRAAADGGYEAANSLFAPEAGAVLVTEALKVAGEV